MAENKIKKIAELSGVSESVVKRALGNYSGISNKTKMRVLEVAEALGVCFKTKSTEVGIVIPTVPTYFWGAMRRGLSQSFSELDADFRFFLFSDIKNELDAINCLDVASKSGISVLIVCPPDTQRIKELIRTLSEKICVIVLEECVDIDGTYFVGEDAYNEGYLVAEKYLESFPESRRFAVISNRCGSKNPRDEGFCDAIKRSGVSKIINIPMDFPFDKRTAGSRFARKIEPVADSIDCIFCSSGVIDMVSAALVKMKRENIHVIGFDSNLTGKAPQKKAFTKLVSTQNLSEQTRVASEVAEKYLKTGEKPALRQIFVKNKLTF